MKRMSDSFGEINQAFHLPIFEIEINQRIKVLNKDSKSLHQIAQLVKLFLLACQKIFAGYGASLHKLGKKF